MAGRLPALRAEEVIRALHRDGWYDHEQDGSHLQLKHPVKPGRVTVPVHRGRTLKAKTLAAILNQASLRVDELRRLL
jgi:predicted RNA binding protein YcfA (HicA-like mRNA interferase family)